MSEPIRTSSTVVLADDGAELFVHQWGPAAADAVRVVVQIVHGAAEHAARYDEVARLLAAKGYAVYADDHRGHGRTAGVVERAGIVGRDSWNRMIEDLRIVTAHARDEHPDAVVLLLGHSMGSMLAQAYAQRHGSSLHGLILSGTASSMAEGSDDLVERVRAAIDREGPDAPSMDFAMLFAEFNTPFVDTAPPTGPTGFEWLSRDQDEVARYVDDPFCGFAFSQQLVLDMTLGLEEIWSDGAQWRLPVDLPVLLIAGQEDPVGANDSVHQLGEAYRARGMTVTEILYPGARHEIFNEINRDEVYTDLLRWIAECVAE